MELSSESTVDLIDFMGGDDSVAKSAWVSFGNDQRDERLNDRGRVEGLINFLWRERHTSPFEHSVFTFRIETPIFVAREFMRHRTFAYNEISGRYTVLPEKFYVPDTQKRPLQQVGKAGNYSFVEGDYYQRQVVPTEMERAYHHALGAYNNMLNMGIAKEVARDVLPVSTYTQFYATVNARNLMHFLNLRTSDHALYEIREVAGKMERHFKDKMPLTYNAWRNK